MTQKLVDTYTYRYVDNGKKKSFTVNYTLKIIAGKLVSVINEYGCECQKTSERFEFYQKRLNRFISNDK